MSVKQCKGYENIASVLRSTEIACEGVLLYISAKTNDDRLKHIGNAHDLLVRANLVNITCKQDLPKRIPKEVCKMLVEFNTWIRCQLRVIKDVKTKEDHISFLQEYGWGMSKYFLWMGTASKYFT